MVYVMLYIRAFSRIAATSTAVPRATWATPATSGLVLCTLVATLTTSTSITMAV